jgi:hypothetical protein
MDSNNFEFRVRVLQLSFHEHIFNSILIVPVHRVIAQVDSGVKRVEEDKKENKVVLYFDQIPKKERSVI